MENSASYSTLENYYRHKSTENFQKNNSQMTVAGPDLAENTILWIADYLRQMIVAVLD